LSNNKVVAQGDEKKDQRSMARKIVDYILRRVYLFHTPDGEAYARTRKGEGHCENLAIRSKDFRMSVIDEARRKFKSAPSRSVVETVLDTLEAAANTQGAEHKVDYRYARIGDEIYIDLGTPNWDMLRVTPRGWKVITDSQGRNITQPKVWFVRHKNMAALPYPSNTPNILALRSLINIGSEEDWRLVVAWLIAAMSGTGPYTILLIQGPQGSSKSALATLLRRIIDPVLRAALRSLWRNEWDLSIAASRSAVLAFDNLSKLTADQSDACCRLATGSGFATRELWTKDAETIFDGMRPLIFNGIGEFATRPDFLERCLVIVLPTIPPEQRRPMTAIQQDFQRLWPDIFAGLLDGLSTMLKNAPFVAASAPNLPRMADFALVAIAAEPACPWEEGGFLKAYLANQRHGQEIAMESDQLAQRVMDLASRLRYAKKDWTGTATELREKLLNPALDNRFIPATASALSSEVRRLQPVLLAYGVEITFSRQGAEGTRTISIAYKPKADAKAASD
jgi:hypothetical protein